MKVKQFFSVKKDEILKLKGFKKFICNVFDISPEKMYQYSMRLQVIEHEAKLDRINVGDIAQFEGYQLSWIIVGRDRDIFELRNLYPQPNTTFYMNEMPELIIIGHE